MSSSTNINTVIVNDEITSFKPYFEESLMEAWYRRQESVESSPNMHIQGFIKKNGVSAYSRFFLDGLTNGHFAMGDPSFAKYNLMSLFGNHGKTNEKIKLQQFKEDLEKVVSNLQEAIKISPSRDNINNLCTYTHSKLKNYNECFNGIGKKVRAVEHHANSPGSMRKKEGERADPRELISANGCAKS
jgi:hypothetical protein